MAEVFLRTGATIQAADKADDNNCPNRPQEPVKLAPFVRNMVEYDATGPIGLGKSNIRFEVAKTDGDILRKVWLKAEMIALPTPSGGTATEARWVDYLGYAMIKNCKVRYGTSTLQEINKDQLFVRHNAFLDDEGQTAQDTLVKGNVIPSRRTFLARRPMKVRAELPTFFSDDESKAFHVQGASQKLTFDFDLEEAGKLIQCNGTSTNIFLADPAAYFVTLKLQCEFHHVLRRERDLGVSTMASPQGYRLLFDDYQWHTGSYVPAAEALNGQDYTIELKNLSKPTKALVVMMRWSGDLDRSCSASGPSDAYGTIANLGGADWFNVSGVHSPLLTPVADSYGPATPLFTDIAIKSGNNYILRKTNIEEAIHDLGWRFCKGTSGIGFLFVPLSLLPTMPNACTGFIDFSVVDSPQLVLTKSSTPNGGYATVGDYAAADIGDAASRVKVDVAAICLDNIDIQSYDLHKPY